MLHKNMNRCATLKYFPADICKAIFALISIACLVTVPLQADLHAALVERDWQVPGDAALTYDTDTGLEWLDLTLTQDSSYNDTASQLGAGGMFDGFQFATDLQLIDLYKAVDLQEQTSDTMTGGAQIELLLDYWGVLYDFGGGERSEYFIANTEGLPAGQHWVGRVVWLSSGNAGVAAKYIGRDDTFENFTTGSALTRPATVVSVDGDVNRDGATAVSYTHLRAHETKTRISFCVLLM